MKLPTGPPGEPLPVEDHDDHVATGACPAVKGDRWCHKPAGHDGPHRTPIVAWVDPQEIKTSEEWE